jgi:hypothetical protein
LWKSYVSQPTAYIFLNLSNHVRQVEGFLTHTRPTKSIYPGKIGTAQAESARTWRPLLRSWVQAVISSDSESVQARTTLEYLAKLAEAGASVKFSDKFRRSQHRNIEFMQDLLGGRDGAAASSGRNEGVIQELRGTTTVQRVFDTMCSSTASIALAAAANGADISVECITSRDGREHKEILLGKSRPHHHDTLYLVRLWLCKPPLQIYKNIGPLKDDQTGRESRTADEISADYGRNVIFGGESEISLTAARELNYWNDKHIDMREHVSALWKAGISEGYSMVWKIKHYEAAKDDTAVQTTPHVYFQLEAGSRVISGAHVQNLASTFAATDPRLQPDPRLKPVARVIAQIVHEQYRYSEYVDCPEKDMFLAAMEFVFIAMSVGCLHTLTEIPSNNFTYALNLGCLTHRGSFAARSRSGELRDLISQALREGVSHTTLLWCAALVWGGASYESQGHNEVRDRVIGVVAPHCTVLLEFIVNPTALAANGIKRKILSIHTGSVPLLCREPSSGFVIAAVDIATQRGRCKTIDCSVEVQNTSSEPPRTDLVITLEPNLLSQNGAASSNYLVCYDKGNLAFELDPLRAFSNLLLRRDDTFSSDGNPLPPSWCSAGIPWSRRSTRKEIRHLNHEELLEHASFCHENGRLKFSTGKKLGWAVACAGCSPLGQAVINTKGIDIETGLQDVQIFVDL